MDPVPAVWRIGELDSCLRDRYDTPIPAGLAQVFLYFNGPLRSAKQKIKNSYRKRNANVSIPYTPFF